MCQATSFQLFTFRVGAGASEFKLHVSCPWRLTNSASVVVGSCDYRRPATADIDEETYDRGLSGSRLLDIRSEHIRSLVGAGIQVLTVEADPFGGLLVQIAGDLRLEIFPDASAADHDEVEFWRLFELGAPHVVVGSSGIDYVTDV